MTPAPVDNSVFDAIAQLLPDERREPWYRLMAHFRRLSPDDEMLHIAEAMGFLALITREAPGAIAAERQKLVEVLKAAGFTPGMLTERARELGGACSDLAAAVQHLTDPEVGAAQRINRALALMQGELENSSRHVQLLTANLRRELRRSIAVIAITSSLAGFAAGWIVGHQPFPQRHSQRIQVERAVVP